MFVIEPRKPEWERAKFNFNKIFTRRNFDYFLNHKNEIIAKLDEIDAKYGIDQWNNRVTAYYDYLNEIMPEFFDALYGIITDEKIIDKRKETIDANLELALIYDLNILYRFNKYTDKTEEKTDKTILRSCADESTLTIYGQNYLDGYYHGFTSEVLNLIRLYFQDCWNIVSYEEYLSAANTFPVLSWYFGCYSDVEDYLESGHFPELNWD